MTKHHKMKIKLTILMLFIILSVKAQSKDDIIIGKRTSIFSTILDSERELYIYLPKSYTNNSYKKYPVMYLLDGKRFFHMATGVISQMSDDISPKIPEMIVVGIKSQNRVRDSSPTYSLIGSSGKEEKRLSVTGGANTFIKFLENELIPFIDNNYRTNDYKVLTGYSFTGLLVTHALFTKTTLFDSYIAVDFSAWFDNEVSLKNAIKFSKESIKSPKQLYITTADRVSFKGNNASFKNDVWHFIKEFEKVTPNQVRFGYKKYDYRSQNHQTMILISLYDALEFIYQGHMLNYDEMFDYPEKIKTKYTSLSTRLDCEVKPNEFILRFLGAKFLKEKNIEKALFCFKYNSENYPLSSKVWIDLADAYKKKNDKAKVIEYYKKALEIDVNNEELKKKLKQISE